MTDKFSTIPTAYGSTPFRQAGMTLLDVLLGIMVFVVGMLALASLQGNLTRSSADANARTVGTNLAEELIEEFRMYERLASADGVDAYQDIVDQTLNETRGGVDYTVAVDVDDYFFLPDGVTVTNDTADLPEGRETSISDFKLVELQVSWAAGEFQRGDGTQTTDRLGSGAVTVSSIIASVPVLGAAKVAAAEEGVGSPPVPYLPGERPDIIRISLGGDKFKESTTPEPVVRRQDELVETWFDVITYSQLGEGSNIFLRREEFLAISCECTLRGATAEAGRLPTVWNGVEYTEGALANKQYGEPANNQQSQYCDVCCRDHHDANSGDTYRPWIPGDQHLHYARDRNGAFSAVDVGDDYIEACRLVRKDGFFRVAQDFKLETQSAFPRDFVEVAENANDYSLYVIDVAQAYFDNDAEPALADFVSFEGDSEENRLGLPSIDPVADSRQLMSRAVYTDEPGSELSANLSNCFPDRGVDCDLPEGLTELEVLPFFDVQVTRLARWTEAPFEDPIDVANEDFSNNGYIRGLAELAGSEEGPSTVTSRIEKSNTGLIDTLPIGPLPDFGNAQSPMFLQAGEAVEPPPGATLVVSGSINAAKNTSDAGIATVTGSGDISCTKTSPGTFACYLPDGGAMPAFPHITVSNYFRNNTTLLVCSGSAALTAAVPAAEFGGTAIANKSFFNVASFGSSSAILTINKDSCPQ